MIQRKIKLGFVILGVAASAVIVKKMLKRRLYKAYHIYPRMETEMAE